MEFVSKIKKFINLEADASLKKYQDLLSLPLKTRIAKGDAMKELMEVDLHSVILNKSYKDHDFKVLAWDINNSKFKVSDYIIIHKGDLNDEDNLYEGIIVFEGVNYFIILRNSACKSFKKEDNARWIMDRNNPDIRHIFIEAMNAFPYHKRKNDIIGIVEGKAIPEYSLNEIKKAIILSKDFSFNRMQKKAFIRALATKNYTLIQGPPGTGKTWLLAHIALKLAESGQTVLITSLTHKAINNALLKVREISEYQNVVKVGQFYFHEGLLEKNIKCFNTYGRREQLELKMSEVDGAIIGGSTYSLYTKRLKYMEFDTIIFDEASQLTISHTVTAMMKADKYIFVGDHKQMPPIFNAKHSDKLLSKSLFENLIGEKDNSTMLDITYRMNNELNNFISESFYKGLLKTDALNANKFCKMSNNISEDIYKILDPMKPNVTIQIYHQGNKMQSEEESNVINILINSLLESGIKAKEIGVIVPYRAQARLIKSHLNNKQKKPFYDEISELIVDTVERMQGQERNIVFISMAASDQQFINENVEFLFNPNRFNVSISRAKYKRIFVCSSNLINTNSEDYQQDIDRFRKLFIQSDSFMMKKQKNVS